MFVKIFKHSKILLFVPQSQGFQAMRPKKVMNFLDTMSKILKDSSAYDPSAQG